MFFPQNIQRKRFMSSFGANCNKKYWKIENPNFCKFLTVMKNGQKKKIVIYVMYVIPHISNRILDFFWKLPGERSASSWWREWINYFAWTKYVAHLYFSHVSVDDSATNNFFFSTRYTLRLCSFLYFCWHNFFYSSIHFCNWIPFIYLEW